MVTRRDFLRQIGQAAVAGTMFPAGAAQTTKPDTWRYAGGVISKEDHPLSAHFHAYEHCRECRMPKCASTVNVEVKVINIKELCRLMEKNKAAIAEIIQTGKSNGRKVFYQVDHKMGPSRVPLSPIR